ncbi:MAG: double zinc ribbon domain-containing protein [Coriobacteriia bacterium]|nr:double zinc ribbon domain-containing protein [Coriobacteriia bacterium]
MLEILKSAIVENLWPTRCVICDRPGLSICKNCLRKLLYIDTNKTCKICGEPYGSIQCCGNHENINRCISATILNELSGRIVTVYKDAGELQLSILIANILFSYMPRSWRGLPITFIPSTKQAYRKRGYDHSEILANKVAELCQSKCYKLFNRPKSADQRILNRDERKQNIKKFELIDKANIESVVIIDDVYTTGATLNSAANTLKKANYNNVYALTFTRTF